MKLKKFRCPDEIRFEKFKANLTFLDGISVSKELGHNMLEYLRQVYVRRSEVEGWKDAEENKINVRVALKEFHDFVEKDSQSGRLVGDDRKA